MLQTLIVPFASSATLAPPSEPQTRILAKTCLNSNLSHDDGKLSQLCLLRCDVQSNKEGNNPPLNHYVFCFCCTRCCQPGCSSYLHFVVVESILSSAPLHQGQAWQTSPALLLIICKCCKDMPCFTILQIRPMSRQFWCLALRSTSAMSSKYKLNRLCLSSG